MMKEYEVGEDVESRLLYYTQSEADYNYINTKEKRVTQW